VFTLQIAQLKVGGNVLNPRADGAGAAWGAVTVLHHETASNTCRVSRQLRFPLLFSIHPMTTPKAIKRTIAAFMSPARNSGVAFDCGVLDITTVAADCFRIRHRSRNCFAGSESTYFHTTTKPANTSSTITIVFQLPTILFHMSGILLVRLRCSIIVI
jgi:hypothetical protein